MTPSTPTSSRRGWTSRTWAAKGSCSSRYIAPTRPLTSWSTNACGCPKPTTTWPEASPRSGGCSMAQPVGRVRACVEGRDQFGGTWRIRRTAEAAEIAIDRPWHPGPQPMLARGVFALLTVFRTWPTTYRCHAAVDLSRPPVDAQRLVSDGLATTAPAVGAIRAPGQTKSSAGICSDAAESLSSVSRIRV